MKKTDIKPILTTRRQLLTLMGLGGVYCYRLDPFRMIARSLVDGLIADAEAQSAPAVKNLLTISLPGAPTRWVWDGFLNLNNQSIVANASLNNWLTSDSYAPAQIAGGYKSEAVLLSTGSTVYLPPL